MTQAKIGLLTKSQCAMVDTLVACSELPLAAVDVAVLGLPPYRCPYGLPVISEGDTVVVVSGWLHKLKDQGFDPVEQILAPLRQRFKRVIGFDHSDPFSLVFSNAMIALMDEVIKVHGVFLDQSLYNFVVGAMTPDGRWTEKVEPGGEEFKPQSLAKLRLGIPCFLAVPTAVRAKTRRFYGQSVFGRASRAIGDRLLALTARPMQAAQPPRSTVHFFASLNHIQRATALRLLQKSTLRWQGGLTDVPPYIVGLNGNGIACLSASEHETLKQRLAAEGLLTRPLNRLQYQLGMADCKAVLSITGYGELCFRMAEAWANRRVLLCQDFSHVQTLFPLQPGRNVVYCRPDLSDLVEILDDIECNFRNYIEIAEQGYQDWLEWSRRPQEILREGFAPLYN